MCFKRKNSLRLGNYDYSNQGPYFVTICSYRKWRLFDKENTKNTVMKILHHIAQRSKVTLHASAIAFDHLHLLLTLPENKRVILGNWIGDIKETVYHFLRRSGGDGTPPLRGRVWQRGFYDHVIRNGADFLEKARYIENHPFKESTNLYTEWH